MVDVLPQYLSSVYLFWDPDLPHLALGKLSALWEIRWVQLAAQACPRLQYYCMGAPLHQLSGVPAPYCRMAGSDGSGHICKGLPPVAAGFVPHLGLRSTLLITACRPDCMAAQRRLAFPACISGLGALGRMHNACSCLDP